jgi:16S rRNA (guanine966-N2)-methyltransferase
VKQQYKNEFRVIAGAWRRRRCSFPSREGLRPTPDRVRETLFNWLAPRIAGARCLDLFAGSGALGIEALSRGAADVVFVERDREAAAAIEANLARLGKERADVAAVDAREYLAGEPEPFDVVFLDPPFASDLLAEVLAPLQSWLRSGAWIYLEFPAGDVAPPLPAGWHTLKASRAGRVHYLLAGNM